MINLKLNEYIPHYKPFKGPIFDTMPQLLEEDRVPLSYLDFIQRRLNCLKTNAETFKETWSHPHPEGKFSPTLGDAVLYHPNGNVKFVPNAEPTWELIKSQNCFISGHYLEDEVTLSEGLYNNLDGEEFTKYEIERYGLLGLLVKEEVLKSPIVKTFIKDDSLLEEHVDLMTQMAEQEGIIWKLGIQEPPIWANAPGYLNIKELTSPIFRLMRPFYKKYRDCITEVWNVAMDFGNPYNLLVGVIPKEIVQKRLEIVENYSKKE